MAAVLGHLFRPLGRHELIRIEEEDSIQAEPGAPSSPSSSEDESDSSSSTPQSRPTEAGGTSSTSVEAILTPNAGGGSAAETEVVVETVEDEETGNAAAVEGVANDTSPDGEASAEGGSTDAIPLGQQDRLRAYLTQRRLVELEEERELRRRRHSTCTLVVVFVLFRLWVEALTSGDMGLMFVCLVGTSWTARWIRIRREEEEEMDRAIEAYVREAANGGADAEGGRTMTAAAGATVDAADLRLMSFQAQLALAILESQRQVMENGGHGHPDGTHGRNVGVSEETRNRWSRYSFHADGEKEGGSNSRSASTARGGRGVRRSGGYGSVSATDDEENGVRLEITNIEEGLATSVPEVVGNYSGLVADGDDDSLDKAKAGIMMDDGNNEQPSCSICLGDYEEGERLIRLPCGHVYHEECVSAWVSNHVRCPLCNYDLEAGGHEAEH
eukprot:CAMPEP_0197441668 /NCGR_PEP_ID=MMETSP1175-20131217/7898_1 /TAXON_ID=1003142 /ORGANISM="Triceratium dubium, Strain CCMP147" /LENGTH=442 /DNA_ID=CAMNT_0042971991 /DNA_START=372 /DNA_END=1700 /DNA_ORIENTATION=-